MTNKEIENLLNELGDTDLNSLALHLNLPRANESIQAPLGVKISAQQRKNFIKWVIDTGNIQKTVIYLRVIPNSKQDVHATKKEMWYQNRTIQAALIGAGVLLFVSIVGWLILSYINKPNIDQSETTKAETEMPKDEEEKISIGDVNGDVVISQKQSGGITAHTVNVGQQPRKVGAGLISQLQQLLPDKTKTVTINSVMGDGEAFNFATQIKDVLVEQGYDVKGVNQAIYSKPIMGQEFNPDTLTLTIGTRQ